MEVEVRVKAPWGNYGLFCGAIRRLWALGTLSSTGFPIPTQHLCHQCLLAHPVLEQFLSFCSIHTPSSFQAPQAVLHSPIILSLHRCLSRKKKKCLFPKMPFPWHRHLSVTLHIQPPSWPTLPNSPQGWAGIHTILCVCFSFLSLVSFPKEKFHPDLVTMPQHREFCRFLWLPAWLAWPCTCPGTIWAEQPSVCLSHLSTPLVSLSRNLPILQNLLSCLRQDFIDDL